METPAIRAEPAAALTVRMLGQLSVARRNRQVDLPPSRKVRALLGYLALAPHPVGRSRLCELLGDVPNDPRGELRWCLSKLRAVLDELDRARVSARGEMISLDLEDCFVDVLQIEATIRAGVGTLDLNGLRELCRLFAGDFLEGLHLNRSPQLDHLLSTDCITSRESHSAKHGCRTNHMNNVPDELRPYVDRWVRLTQFDARAQIRLPITSVESVLPAEAQQHMAAVVRLIEA